jgi:two-component system response regulator PilR (NtrC family)
VTCRSSPFILQALAGKSGEAVGQLLPAARQALEAYEFPGNVRELENILERAMAMCDGNSIDA